MPFLRSWGKLSRQSSGREQTATSHPSGRSMHRLKCAEHKCLLLGERQEACPHHPVRGATLPVQAFLCPVPSARVHVTLLSTCGIISYSVSLAVVCLPHWDRSSMRAGIYFGLFPAVFFLPEQALGKHILNE